MGAAFERLLGDKAVPLTRTQIDLTHADSISDVLNDLRVDSVINCAAYTKVDRAESEEGLATLINSRAVGAMAAWAAGKSVPFVTFSTDYVFNGKSPSPYVESSPVDPINAYGRSKVEGERLAVAAGGLVVRTSWVISGSHPNFVATMLRMAQKGSVRVVDDQQGCPTVSSDLARTTIEALGSGVIGLLHVTNQGPTTWFQLARAAVAEAGLDPGKVTACTTAEYPTEAMRPAYSILASERLDALQISGPPHWRESLPSVVSEIKTWL